MVSNVHRLRITDRVFFISVNLRRAVGAFRESEYPLLIDALEGARRRLGFLMCGYVLMPGHWHALIWTGCSISRVIHDIKKLPAQRLHERRGTRGPVWQHLFWDHLVRPGKKFNDRLTYMHLNPVGRQLVSRQKSAHGQKNPDRDCQHERRFRR